MDLQKWVQSEVDKHGSANRFAAILGVARQAVSDWLSGKKLLKDRSIEAIAQYMGKTPEEVRRQFNLEDFAAYQSKARTRDKSLPKGQGAKLEAENRQIKKEIDELREAIEDLTVVVKELVARDGTKRNMGTKTKIQEP
ncbi:helix-turn-helix domain-containing protein [Pseudanabaena sp. PCC 6802]|jgi:transcriptional regulator with XRE-family HTH domain|uniref:helix-turn-helix domain-containing protein n=1 Tax=Pseudanabaena sp. PCC 6802 TaxID=118173 RepID=UPI0003455405|nr:helix-turn-helix transcriptional regulator [Pseudanabaena sp. PCC 6802]